MGTVDTVAGPGFCEAGAARPDPSSTAVGDIAAHQNGTLWFESGVTGDVVKAINSTTVDLVKAAVETPPRAGQGGSGASAPRRKPPSRLAADGESGLIVAAPTAVLHFVNAPVTIAGTTAPDREGDASQPLAGDGGPLAAARFTLVAAIAADRSGNVYVADEIDSRTSSIAIRFLNRGDSPITFYPGTAQELTIAPGTVDTIAGGGRGRLRGELVAARPALAVAGERLYLGATLGGAPSRATVRVLDLAGTERPLHGRTVASGTFAEVATVQGRGAAGQTGGTRPASVLSGIAAGDDGNLYLAEPANHRVRRVDAAGVITTFAGTGAPGFNGNGQPAVQAQLALPYDVEVGAQGRVFIADAGNSQVRFVDTGGTIHAALGNGFSTGWVCDGADSSGFAFSGQPSSLVVDAVNVYIVAERRQIFRLGPSGSPAPVAGGPAGFCDNPGGCPGDETKPPTTVDLSGMLAAGARPGGGLYLLEPSRVRLLNLSTRSVTAHGVVVPAGTMRTVAGVAQTSVAQPTTISPPSGPAAEPPSPTPDGGRAIARSQNAVFTAVAADRRGNLLVGDLSLHPRAIGRASVRQIDAEGTITTLVTRPEGRSDGTIDSARCCAYVAGLRADDDGNVYIADTVGGRVWFLNRGSAQVVVHGVTVAPGAVEAVAGAGVAAGGSQEEGIPAIQAQLTRPRGLALAASGALYLVDSREHSVHRVDSGGIITTVIGTGQPGFNGDGLRGQLTSLNEPVDVALDVCGNLLVSDLKNNRVRRLNIVASCRATGGPRTPGGTSGPLVSLAGAAVAVAALGVAWGAAVRRRRQRLDPAKGGCV